MAPFFCFGILNYDDDKSVEEGETNPSSQSGSTGECRLVERPDCPCCKVCAVDAVGAACDPDKLPCDANKGLECDAATSICKGRRAGRQKISGFCSNSNSGYGSNNGNPLVAGRVKQLTTCRPLLQV